MQITNLPAYTALKKIFEEKGYTEGIQDNMPIYSWNDNNSFSKNLTPGHYVDAINYCKIKFKDVPKKFLTREFFLHALSGAYEDIVDYVKENPQNFDKQFFKDHIQTDYYSLEFELNDFEYMPLEYIDEEMVMCAMFKSIDMRYVDRRGDCSDWFYSVSKRKPEVLTQELYTLGARCFAAKRNGKNKFLDITPNKFKTPEFYFALCLENSTPVMEDIPEEVLTTDFLVTLLNDTPQNIQCFSESALEKEAKMQEKGTVKFWQAAILLDGYQIKSIPLNDERIEYFLSLYGKNSPEYEYGFKSHYKAYLREKNFKTKPQNNVQKKVELITLSGALSGMDSDSAVEIGNAMLKSLTDYKTLLPIHYNGNVPTEYSKKYDKEEYLVEIYKKLDISIIDEFDSYYYLVNLPENLSIFKDDYGFTLKDSNQEVLVHYYDRGPFYDRTVTVDQINITL